MVFICQQSVDRLVYIMFTGTQKRRNFSKETALDSRLYYHRNLAGNTLSNSYSAVGLLKERALNRALGNLESDENLTKKKTIFTPSKPTHHLSVLDNRYFGHNSKPKSFLKSEGSEEDKENTSTYHNTTSHIFQKTRSAIFKRSQINLKQFLEQGSSNPPYFIECLKRKSIISTQACMHVHNSMLTFRQYLRTVQLLKSKPIDPKIPIQREGRKTIVFDMDETLIHTSQIMMRGYEIKVPFKSMQGKIISGYVNVRPHAKEIIKNLSKFFDIMVFTAGNQCYAEPILDYLDPQGCIVHRLYRESCTMVNNQLFVKDLRVLGRKLENVVLVDNAPHSYMMQLSNGIPILSYLKGKDDDQLIRLQSYLMSLLQVQDVRVVNNMTFRLSEYHRYDSYQKLLQQLYGKWL